MILLTSFTSFSQSKAIVLENLWVNELNNFNPKEFHNSIYTIIKDKLELRQIVEDPLSRSALQRDEKWGQTIKDKIKARNIPNDSAVFIAISADLRLPIVNLGRLLFKNPPRSSKLIFTIHVFDAAANQLLTDTIVNRSCIVKTVEEGKGGKNFYTDYEGFISDMRCHLDFIKKNLQQRAMPKLPRYRTI